MQRLRQDRLSGSDPEPAPVRRGMPAGRRRVRRARRVDRRRRAAAPQGNAGNRQGHHEAQEVRVPVHERALDGKEDGRLPAEPVFRLVGPPRRRQGHARPFRVAGRRVRQGGRGDQGSEAPRLPREHQLHAVQRCDPRARREVLRHAGPDRRRRHHRVAGLRVRARAGSAALPEPRQDEEPVPRNPEARRRRQALVVQPVVAVPRLPGRQPDVQVHAVGQSGAYGVRLAEAVLPGRRRLREDLQGTDGNDGVGQLRRRQLREVRGLHGPLRLRGDGRDGHDLEPAEGAAREPQGHQDRRPVRTGHLDREAASGRVRVLAPRRDQARGNPARRQGQAAEAGEVGNGRLSRALRREKVRAFAAAGIEKAPRSSFAPWRFLF
ncbi:hypothetical protein F01_500030 [Burkholderia cenocepacia]|nr:hypothetical protein F01_500030 [Burkholderia cenocepacia]